MHILSRILPLTVLFFSPSLASLEADQGNWTVEGCILVRMAAQVRHSGTERDGIGWVVPLLTYTFFY